jgi:hypothetical protein
MNYAISKQSEQPVENGWVGAQNEPTGARKGGKEWGHEKACIFVN